MTENKFEDAMTRLEQIVHSMEDGNMPLEESIRLFEEGMRLSGYCAGKLEEAEKKVSLLVRESGGKNVLTPFKSGEEDDED